MNDREFWDSYLSSIEDLNEDPPPEVKEAIFRRMRRYQRRRRWMRRIGPGLLGLLLLAGGGLLLEPFEEGGASPGPEPKAPKIRELSLGELQVGPSPKEEGDKRKQAFVQDRTYDRKDEASSNGRTKKIEKGKVAEGSEAETIDARAGTQAGNDKGSSVQNPAERPTTPRKGPSDKRVTSSSGSNAPSEKEKASDDGKWRSLPYQGPEVETPDPLASASWEKKEATSALEQNEPSTRSAPRFFLGSDLAFNFTRLMDNRTKESFERTSLLSTDGRTYLDFSLTGGYHLSDNSRLIARYFMKKDFGQHYYEYVDGRYKGRGLQLSYRNYELLFEHDLYGKAFSSDFEGVLSAYGGGHISSLQKAEVMDDGRARKVGGNYKDVGYGVEAGLRIGMKTRAGFDVGLLFGGSYSLSDIRAASSERSLTGQDSHLLSTGAALSVRYHFGRRSAASLR